MYIYLTIFPNIPVFFIFSIFLLAYKNGKYDLFKSNKLDKYWKKPYANNESCDKSNTKKYLSLSKYTFFLNFKSLIL